MNFRFRLEKVLHFVKLRETVKKMEVSAITQRIRFLEGRRQTLQENIRALLARQGEAPNGEFQYFQTSKVTLDVKDLSQLDVVIRQEQVALERRKNDLARLFQRRRALESLKDKKEREFRTEQGHKQQAQLDEIFSLSRGKRW